MKNTRLHFHGFEVGFMAAMAALTVLSVPTFAEQQEAYEFSEEHYANVLIKTFSKIGAETSNSFDNRRLETSGFDFAQYGNHTCFRATEFDVPGCKTMFGPYHDLRTTQASGTLARILKRYTYLSDASALVATSTKQVGTETSVSTSSEISSSTSSVPKKEERSDSAERKEIDVRSSVLWKLCQDKYEARRDSVRCYQRNIRRTMIETRLPDPETVF